MRTVAGPCVCSTLRRAARTVSILYDHCLREADLTVTQYGILARLGREGGISRTGLAELMGMDRTTMTRNLQPLIRRRFVSAKAGEDRRQRVLRLTASGQDRVDKSYALWAEAQLKMIAKLGDERWRQLQELLAAAEQAAA